MTFLSRIENTNQLFKISLGLALIATIGAFDFLTGYEISFSLFYVIPISLLTWLIGKRMGIIASVVSACVWLGADMASGHLYSHSAYPLWNTFVRLSFFIIITLLLSALRTAMQHEKELARTDSLTGAVNLRFFFELTTIEIDRMQRHKRPFTLVYIDLDNFKAVNDCFGHLTGDQVLCTVVRYAKKHLRKTDVVARLGGDEFALLLHETSQKSARVALTKLQDGLLNEMRQNDWPITFSMGVLTCTTAPPSCEELVRMADDLMYSVKREGKNAIKYSTYEG